MRPNVFRPQSLQEACSLLEEHEEALVYGGGTALQILLKQGILVGSSFIDISGIPGLAEISFTDDFLRVGPMVTLRRMERSEEIRELFSLASSAYAKVANPRVRNTATVGGNIAHGDYRLDPPVALLVLGASVELTSRNSIRKVPLEEFFVDFQVTDISAGEIVTAVEIPRSIHLAGSSFVKLSSLSANDWPSASAAAGLMENGNGVHTLRLALGALAATPVMATVDIRNLNLDQTLEASLSKAMELMDPIADVRGSVKYKLRLGRVAVEEAIRSAWKEVPNGR